LEHLFLKSNFKRLIFKSHAGKKTIFDYGGVTNHKVLEKVDVVYPAIRKVNDGLIRYSESKVNITFVGNFLAKGGSHVVDVFREIRKIHKNIQLRLCSDESLNSTQNKLTRHYREIIRSDPSITIGLVDREQMMNEVLPNTDIFISPTYRESYGFAVQEALAYGIPVITSNHGALPELVQHDHNGYLIDTESFDFIRNLKSYSIDVIPDAFNQHMNIEIYRYLKLLIESPSLRRRLGENGLMLARTKFSFERRNEVMSKVYEECIR
jgi:glycosyltransferase involved in cell wall biosynthesis